MTFSKASRLPVLAARLCLLLMGFAGVSYGAVRLDLARLRTVQGHAIGTTYVDYHNKSIFTGRSKKVRSNNRIHADARKSGARG